MLKFLMVLNLAIVVLMSPCKTQEKYRIFQGHFFSNMVKIKLFIADTGSYVPLQLNKLARKCSSIQIDRYIAFRQCDP